MNVHKMNVQKLEELVTDLAVELINRQLTPDGLQRLEFFAYGAQGSPQTDLVAKHLLRIATLITVYLENGQLNEAMLIITELGGYVERLSQEAVSQEAVQHTTNGEVKDASKTLEYIAGQNVVKMGEREVRLRGSQAQLMGFLYKHPNVMLSQDCINEGAWNGTKSNKSAFGYAMHGLLSKIQPGTEGPKYVQEFHGQGFIFNPYPTNVRYPRVEYDPNSGLVKIDGTEMRLRGKRKAVMDFLYSRPNITHTTGDISEAVWGEGTDCKRSALRLVIYRLNSKFMINPTTLSPIVGTPDQGYMLKI